MIRNLMWLYTFLFLLILIVSCADDSNHIYTKISKKDFLDIIQDAEFAITENNFRIINRLHIGQSIRDRGTELFPKNEVILFCNLTLAEEMLRLKPDHINYCPYKITITGTGNIELIKPLAIQFPEDFEIYDPKITDKIFEGGMTPGLHRFLWDASAISSGIYFINITDEHKMISERIILQK